MSEIVGLLLDPNFAKPRAANLLEDLQAEASRCVGPNGLPAPGPFYGVYKETLKRRRSPTEDRWASSGGVQASKDTIFRGSEHLRPKVSPCGGEKTALNRQGTAALKKDGTQSSGNGKSVPPLSAVPGGDDQNVTDVPPDIASTAGGVW